MEWDRNTEWRQGHVLPDVAIEALNLGRADGEPAIALVVTHDCDLAQEPLIEPEVELIVGRQIAQADGNYAYAKNARRLHLTLTGGMRRAVVELAANAKKTVPKERLGTYKPSEEITITSSERTTLQQWLAARYRRAAFPDEFDRRLDSTGVRSALTKILKRHGNSLRAMYFEVDQGKEVVKRSAEDPYTLSIYLLYVTQDDTIAAEAAAQRAASEITTSIRNACWSASTGKWMNIELVECEAVSEESMSVRLSIQLSRWSADHISLRTDPPGPISSDD